MDCSPRILPRLKVANLSFWFRKLRWRKTVPFGANEDVDSRAPGAELIGCKIWLLLTAV